MIYVRMEKLQGTMFERRFADVTDKTVRRKTLRMIGQDVRNKMRRSIKPSKPDANGRYRPSTPGGLPFFRAGQGKSRANSLFVGSKFLIYRYDNATESVVIGPRKLGGGRPMPETLEFGGTRTSSVAAWSGVRHRKVGHGGEMRIGGEVARAGRTTRLVTESGETTRVVYARIRTQAQADRANERNRRVHLPPGVPAPPPNGSVKTTVRARPYIRPTVSAYRASGKASKVLAQALKESDLLNGSARSRIRKDGQPDRRFKSSRI